MPRLNEQTKETAQKDKVRTEDRNKRKPEHTTETTDKTITIHTTEGQYEAILRVDNTNNCPLQEKLGLTRYRISEPPRMMRNIPKYHTTKKLPAGQVLKFDISRPDPDRQLWSRKQKTTRRNPKNA